MAITYRDSNGKTTKVQSVVFNGTEVMKLRYDCGNGQKSLVWCKPYTLSVSKGIGVSTVTVTRTASQEPSATIGVLPDDSTIYYGDTITVSAVAQIGFVLKDYTKSYTVTGDLTISISATVNQYMLSINRGAGVSLVTVTRTSSPNGGGATGVLTSGATIYYGDQLSVTATPSVGYTLNGFTDAYVVQGDVSVSVTAYVQSFILSLSQGTGVSSVTVQRTSSPKKGAATGTLANGSIIYYGDILTVKALSVTGYTVNSSSYSSSYTVTGNISLNVTAMVSRFTLTINKNVGVSYVIVQRTSSPKQGAATGQLNDGDVIYFGDVLTVSADAGLGYVLNSYITSYSVEKDVTVNIIASARPYLTAPGVSGTLTHDSSSGAMYLSLVISNPNSIPVDADIKVFDVNSSNLLYSDTIHISNNESGRKYNVGEIWATKVKVTVTLKSSTYAAMSSTITIQGSSNSGGSSSSSSGQS